VAVNKKQRETNDGHSSRILLSAVFVAPLRGTPRATL
jgi:hypothetical protein